MSLSTASADDDDDDDDVGLAASWGCCCHDMAARFAFPTDHASVAIRARPVHPKECSPLNPCPVCHKQQAATGRGRISFECMGVVTGSAKAHTTLHAV